MDNSFARGARKSRLIRASVRSLRRRFARLVARELMRPSMAQLSLPPRAYNHIAGNAADRGQAMSSHAVDTPPLQDPMAVLERELLHAYLAGAGHDFHTLAVRDDDEARQLLRAASQYASAKLSEIEARLHYLRQLHG